jgi:hypothetical protein
VAHSTAWLGQHTIYINARSRSTSKTPPWKRVQAISAHDGFYAKVEPSLGVLLDPSQGGVLGGLTSVPSSSSTDKHRHLYFVIANGSSHPLPGDIQRPDRRYNLTLHRSSNGGRSWDAHKIWEGYSGYNALAPINQNGSGIGVLWESSVDEGCDLACGLSFGIIQTD